MEKYQKPQICRWYHPYGRSEEPFDEGERGEWKADLKLNIQKIKIMASSSITLQQMEGEKVEDFLFLGSKTTVDGDCSREIRRSLLFV